MGVFASVKYFERLYPVALERVACEADYLRAD